MQRLLSCALLLPGLGSAAFATAPSRVSSAAAEAHVAGVNGGETEPHAAGGASDFVGDLVMLALNHFLEKRPPPARWAHGQNFMVRHVELSPDRGQMVCGEPPVGAWGGLGTFPTTEEHACNNACLADPQCGYAVFQVENGECTGFAECSFSASTENRSGTFIVNERTTYACSTSPSWCGACKHAGMSAAAADSCRVVGGEWYCAGVATCVAAGAPDDSSGDCTPGTLVCAGRGPRAGRLGSSFEQASAVIAALDVRSAHPSCPRYDTQPSKSAVRIDLALARAKSSDASEAEASQHSTSTGLATVQRVCSAEEKATMHPKWLQDGSRLEQMCSVYSPPAEYKAMADMPPPAMWKPEEGTPECCDDGQSCEVAGFRILENFLTMYSLCVPTANWTAI